MSKRYEEALAALAGVDGGVELVEAVKGQVGKVSNEAKNLRDRLKTAEVKAGHLKKFYDLHGLADDSDDIDSTIEQIKTKMAQSGKTSETQMKTLETRLRALETERDSAIAESRKERASSELTKLLNESKVLPTVFGGLKDVLMTKVKFGDDGKPVYVSDDGTDIPVTDGVKKYLTANPGFVSNVQQSGNGGKGDNAGGSLSLKQEEIAKLPPKERAEFFAKGGTPADE